jgi:hypothetical protein
VRYFVLRPLTVETRLSLATRLAPTGTRTARSAICWACSTGVFGWVDVLVLGVAGLRAGVVRLVLADLVPRGVLLVAIVLLPTNQDIEVCFASG